MSVLPFAEVLRDVSRGVKKVPQREFLAEGLHPIIDQGQQPIAGYCNTDEGLCTTVPAIVFGDHTRCVKFAEEPFAAGADGVKILVPLRGNDNPRYLYHALRSADIPSLGYSRHYKLVKELSFVVPERKQQDEAVELLDAIEYQTSATGEQLKALDELVKSRFVEMFESDDWPVSTLDELADVQGGLTKNKGREQMELQLPYLRVANVLQGEFDLTEMMKIGLTEAEREKTLLRKDDLLFVEGNGSKDQIGRSAIWDGSINPCVHQNHLIRARFGERVLPVFALAYFTSPGGREQIVSKAVSTSGLFTLSTGKIKSLTIPVPPLALQQEFAAFVQQVDKLKFETQQAISKLQMLYDSLAQEYFAIE